MPLLPKSEISSLKPYSVIIKISLLDLIGNPEDRFSREVAHILFIATPLKCMFTFLKYNEKINK